MPASEAQRGAEPLRILRQMQSEARVDIGAGGMPWTSIAKAVKSCA